MKYDTRGRELKELWGLDCHNTLRANLLETFSSDVDKTDQKAPRSKSSGYYIGAMINSTPRTELRGKGTGENGVDDAFTRYVGI